ncbi:hypothetical protein F441_20394 [Phytophthora nicotianae CJ01A1]|uniref:Uncharacterized protein n=2 Tax=Phytophthora nicotianae TaxID=4792 RepID=W2VW91_PHYNI|nr:hypothetical protein L916_19831 [Phytophthora nicotianae]ETP02560.1 hypothetical protein F441_20394 [Phytophthora nicotianae CJ01A1]
MLIGSQLFGVHWKLATWSWHSCCFQKIGAC